MLPQTTAFLESHQRVYSYPLYNIVSNEPLGNQLALFSGSSKFSGMFLIYNVTKDKEERGGYT
jgi:hypothetical protein